MCPFTKSFIHLILYVSILHYLCIYYSCQHTYGHHNYTNVDGSDPDIVTTDDVRKSLCTKTFNP